MANAVMSPADVRDAGRDEYADFVGVDVLDPRVSARSRVGAPYDVDSGRSKFITTPGTDTMPSEGPGVHLLEDWRDAFNPGSPAFWILLFILAIVGFMQFRLQVGGRRGATVGLG